MAITIEKDLPSYSPVYNEMVTTLSSTNVAQPNFSYLIDVYINGSVTKEARIRVSPENDYNYGIFDAHRILESFVNSDVGDTTATNGIVGNENSIISYQLKFGEEYGTPLVQYPDLTVNSVVYAYNAALTYNEFVDYNESERILRSSVRKYLTDQPTVNTSITDSGWLYFIPRTTTSKVDVIEIETFDSAGASIGVWEIQNNTTFATIGEYLLRVPSNPVSINLIDNAEFASGVQPVIDSSTASYTIKALDSGSGVISETKTYNIQEPCKYEKQRLIFLNKWGGFDGFNFNLVHRETAQIEKRNYKKNPKRIDSSGGYTYTKQQRSKVQYYTKSVSTVQLTSNFVNEETYRWLKELVESPEIYLENEDNELIALQGITNTEWTEKTDVNDSLYNLEVTIEFTNDNYRQRG